MKGEVLAGAALTKSSVSAIKSAIGTAQDVGEIAGFIDQVFLGQQQVKKAQEEGNSLNSVAKDMIDAELAREATQQLKLLVNMRFGSGTWERIEKERSRRVKDAERRAKAQAARRTEQVQIVIVLGVLGAVAAGMIAGLAWYYLNSR